MQPPPLAYGWKEVEGDEPVEFGLIPRPAAQAAGARGFTALHDQDKIVAQQPKRQIQTGERENQDSIKIVVQDRASDQLSPHQLRLCEYDPAERLREGGCLFVSFKVYAQHCFRFVEPVPERCRLCILRVEPAAHLNQKIPEMFSREPNLYDMKHGPTLKHCLWANTFVRT